MHRPAKARADAARDALAALPAPEVELPPAAEIAERWDDLSLAQQRAVLDRLIERIVVVPARPGSRGFDPTRIRTPKWRA
jgi:hypothetical protein